MTTADCMQDDLVTAAKQEILAKFQGTVLDNPEFSGVDFAALLRAAREGDDDDFVKTLLQIFLAEHGETMEETIQRVVAELREDEEDDDESGKIIYMTPSNELGKGVAILGVAIVAAASLFAPIDPVFQKIIVGGAVVLGIMIGW